MRGRKLSQPRYAVKTASCPTSKLPDARPPAVAISTSPRPMSAAPWLKAWTPSSSTRSRTAVCRRRSTRTCSRDIVGSIAAFTFTVVAAAMTSPSRPLTAAEAERSATRYCLMRPSSARVASATPASGSSRTAAAPAFVLPSTAPASTVNTSPADTSIMPSTNIVTSSVSSRKCVTASPDEPTGCPASGPPLATCAASRLARSSVCMWTHACVHMIAP